MPDKITSNKQSGGITAKNVTVGTMQSNHQVQLQASSSAHAWKFIAGAIGLIASILGILQFFEITPWSK